MREGLHDACRTASRRHYSCEYALDDPSNTSRRTADKRCHSSRVNGGCVTRQIQLERPSATHGDFAAAPVGVALDAAAVGVALAAPVGVALAAAVHVAVATAVGLALPPPGGLRRFAALGYVSIREEEPNTGGVR